MPVVLGNPEIEPRRTRRAISQHMGNVRQAQVPLATCPRSPFLDNFRLATIWELIERVIIS